MSTEILIRTAGPADRDELRAMQARSFLELGAACYERSVIEAFIRVIGTMDDSLLEQGTYYAAVAGGAIVGCGGWSDRTPGYAVHPVEASGRSDGKGYCAQHLRASGLGKARDSEHYHGAYRGWDCRSIIGSATAPRSRSRSACRKA